MNSGESFLAAEFEISPHKKIKYGTSFLADGAELAGTTAQHFATQTATQPGISYRDKYSKKIQVHTWEGSTQKLQNPLSFEET